jgi:hypothetical protein
MLHLDVVRLSSLGRVKKYGIWRDFNLYRNKGFDLLFSMWGLYSYLLLILVLIIVNCVSGFLEMLVRLDASSDIYILVWYLGKVITRFGQYLQI